MRECGLVRTEAWPTLFAFEFVFIARAIKFEFLLVVCKFVS